MRKHPAANMGQFAPTFGARFQALLIDHLVVLSILIMISFTSQFLITYPTGVAGIWVFSGILHISLFLLYKTGLEAYYGQTYGKAACDITVRHVDGSPIRLGTALVRNLLLVVDYLPGWFLLGLYVIHQRENKQRIGDIAADTVVVLQQP